MSLAQAWQRLGLAPTHDAGAIRRAYADALRAMDVDVDVAGFAALRTARDTALAWARRQGESTPDPVVAPEDLVEIEPGVWPYGASALEGEVDPALVARGALGEPVLVPGPRFSPAQGAADPQFALTGAPFAPVAWQGAPVDGVSRRPQVRDDHGLHAILLEGPGVEFALTEAEQGQAMAHLSGLIAEAEEGSADLWARTEEWLAETLARGWPRSALLLDFAARTFGWAGRPATTADSPAIAFLVPRVGTTPVTRPPQPLQTPLHILLLEHGPVDEPLDPAQKVQAHDMLEAVLREADGADAAARRKTATWLARLLVQSWPRSAPLVARAAQAFGWEDFSSPWGEQPDIAFLTARLRGMRFVEEVRVPGHRLNRAWRELTRTGKHRNPFVSRREVLGLLESVRDHFPELEHHFNPVLVSHWARGKGPLRDNIFVLYLVCGLGLVFLANVFGGDHGSARKAPYPAVPQIDGSVNSGPAVMPAFDPATDSVLAQAVHAVFGPDIDYARLRARNPNLAATLMANRRLTADADLVTAKARLVLGLRLTTAIHTGNPARLDALARWRLGQLRLARQDGVDTCRAMLEGSPLPEAVVWPPAQAAQEQRLARIMLDAGELDPPPRPRGERRTFSVPGLFTERVRASTGLPDSVVTAALVNQGKPEQVCAVRIAVLATALDWKGSERTAILRAI